MKLAGTRLQHHPSRAGITRASKAGPVWTGAVRFNEGWLDQPLRWKRPRMIFVCAHGDLFHESVPDEWIDRVFAVMALARQHTFQVLTKRSRRMRDYFAGDPARRIVWNYAERLRARARGEIRGFDRIDHACDKGGLVADFDHADIVPPLENRPLKAGWPLPNVWLGVSVEDQQRADERLPDLGETPAAVRYASVEPMLGPVDLTRINLHYLDNEPLHWSNALNGIGYSLGGAMLFHHENRSIDWVICGGESGHGARPMHPDWARSLRDQCAAANVPFFFKQWGAWAPGESCNKPFQRSESVAWWWNNQWLHDCMTRKQCETMEYDDEPDVYRVGKKAAGRLLDGIVHNAMPETA